MAKVSVIQRNLRREALVKKYASVRADLKAIIYNKTLPLEDRMSAQFKIASLPRDSSRTRVRNRCLLTGRGRGVYRRFKISRICIRELASQGHITGLRKASW